MPHFGTNVNQKMRQYANHIIYQHSKTNFEKFCLRFYITKKGSPNICFQIVSPNCPKRLKNRLFLPESPLFKKAKIYRNLSLSGQKLSIMILENSSDYRHFDNDKLSIANTTWKGSSTMASSVQSDVLQILNVLSSDWLAKYLPTGSKKTPLTRLVWPRSMVICSGILSMLQMMMLLSTLAVANTESPGPQARSRTSPSWPRRVW
jgi:hypothetical protein